MFDRDYEIARLTMRERERDARLQRMARDTRGDERGGWLARLVRGVSGTHGRLEERRAAARQALGCESGGEGALVHRPWRDGAR